MPEEEARRLREAAHLSDEREARAKDLASAANEKAKDLAYEKGKDDEETRAHFRDHDRHLAAINGSVAAAAEALALVERRLWAIESNEKARDAVTAATAEAVEKHGRAQITTRTFYLGLAGLLLAVGGLFMAVQPG